MIRQTRRMKSDFLTFGVFGGQSRRLRRSRAA
jgi:hypothetical protein